MVHLALAPFASLVLTPLVALTGLVYTPPVEAPIVDHFRPPSCTWCPGNRGIDYSASPGTPVRAAAGGVVTFAGAIGGDRYVTIAHPDGLRTSYAYLATITVHAGQRVGPGAGVGVTGGRFHFGVRRGAVYLDPERLFQATRLVARLVPLSGRPSTPRPGPVRVV
jgi:murein DD-endopeptidase MepM/ murein hydrolase activator NlpD